MADTLSTEQRSERMSRIRAKDTAPEMVVRRLVHKLGFRFRLHRRDLPGTPDLVFAGRKKAIFVHGCFWHRHDDSNCRLARLPKSRLEFWEPKLERNRERDIAKYSQLQSCGWDILVIWECQTKNTAFLEATIQAFLHP